jgi:hypothetical protein
MRFAASRRLGLHNGSVITLRFIPTPLFRHSLSALVFATQSPYPGRQTVAYSRNVMRNTAKNLFKITIDIIHKYDIIKK